MRKIKIVIEYEGTRYHGWQYQPNGMTIQEMLESCLRKITKKKTGIVGAGRTDSGVHAEGQVAHFLTSSRMKPREFLKAFNSLLPPDIVIREVEEVDTKFHARRSARAKVYRYAILNRDFPSALFCRQAHYLSAKLNLSAMRRAARDLVGRHDFTSFRGAGCEARSSRRRIHRLAIAKKGDIVYLTVEGDGFLKHMVRNIVGTLIEVGQGRRDRESMKALLKARDRRQAGPTAPARGLFLVRVLYDPPAKKKKAR